MSIIDRHADLQAILDDAFRRGAEAMREAAAKAVQRRAEKLNEGCEYASVEWDTNAVNCSYRRDCVYFDRTENADAAAAAIRALPLPEPKP